MSPSDQNIVHYKWVYKIKYHWDGTAGRCKARLVAEGFHQRASIDYNETFSPAIKPLTVCLLLSLAIWFSWHFRQLDVKNTFLHGHLTEKVYKKQLLGFIHPDFSRHVCKLKKVIYGLKQAPHAWFQSFSSFLLSHSFVRSHADPSIFIAHTYSHILVLLLYVDDIVLIGNSEAMLQKFITLLLDEFAMKEPGDLYYGLGI